MLNEEMLNAEGGNAGRELALRGPEAAIIPISWSRLRGP
jgi:hypothetical protein